MGRQDTLERQVQALGRMHLGVSAVRDGKPLNVHLSSDIRGKYISVFSDPQNYPLRQNFLLYVHCIDLLELVGIKH